MKTFGIIAAMDEEIVDLKNMLELDKIVDKPKLKFYIGSLFENQKIILVKSGIGKVNAAACTQSLIDLFNVEYIINVGVSGAVSNNLKIGDLIVANDLVQYDFDLSAFDKQIGFIPDLEQRFFESDKKLLNLINDFCLVAGKNSDDNNYEKKNKIYFGRIASGDKFVCNPSDKNFIRNNFGADCVEMEGAAIAQVAFINKIPFVVIRVISDGADQNAVKFYDESVDSVTNNYLDIVKHILKSY